MKLLFTIFLVCATASFGFAQEKKANPVAKREFPDAPQNIPTLSFKIIPAPNQTWGYDIYSEGKPFIHQPGIPGMPGNDGFKTKAGAEKVARLVIEKIKRGEMPPTVEMKEMEKLKAI